VKVSGFKVKNKRQNSWGFPRPNVEVSKVKVVCRCVTYLEGNFFKKGTRHNFQSPKGQRSRTKETSTTFSPLRRIKKGG
jgi:hypothetical protein